MKQDYLTAQVTFLYFDDIGEAADFLEGVLGLERVYDIGWCYIWRTAEKAFVGACDQKRIRFEIHGKDGVMISLSVRDVAEVRERILQSVYGDGLPEIAIDTEVPLKSLIFKGPGGYLFEIMEFTDEELLKLF